MAEFKIDRDGDLRIAGHTAVVVVPAYQIDDLRDLITPAAEVAAPPRWHINEAARLYFGSHHVYWHTDQVSDQIDTDEAAEPRTFGDMADWLVEHQPAATLEQVEAWGIGDDAAPHVHAFIQQQITKSAQQPAEVPARYQWSRDMDGDLCCRDLASGKGGCVMIASMTHDPRNARLLTDWIVDTQPQALPLPLADLRGMDSWRVYNVLKPLMDGAQQPAESVPPLIRWRTTTDSSENGQPTLQLSTDDGNHWEALYTVGYFSPGEFAPYAKHVAEAVVAQQPQIKAEGMRACISGSAYEAYTYLLHTTGFDVAQDEAQALADSMPLPFTPDRAEVSDDPRFWAGAVALAEAQIAQLRMLRVSFTFDPSDINTALLVYAALEQLPYDIRKAVEIR